MGFQANLDSVLGGFFFENLRLGIVPSESASPSTIVRWINMNSFVISLLNCARSILMPLINSQMYPFWIQSNLALSFFSPSLQVSFDNPFHLTSSTFRSFLQETLTILL